MPDGEHNEVPGEYDRREQARAHKTGMRTHANSRGAVDVDPDGDAEEEEGRSSQGVEQSHLRGSGPEQGNGDDVDGEACDLPASGVDRIGEQAGPNGQA